MNWNFVSVFVFVVLISDSVFCQSSQLSQQGRSCSFSDESTGYFASWHTNCTGYVNFVLNFRNFPVYGGNYWTGIGFGLLSLELVLVEVINGFVTVQPAKLYANQPPQKNLMSPLLVSPQGAFFGASLEATFAIHESLLTGCKDWTFYTVPSRVGAPYAGQPFSKLICNVAETCSRNNCIQNQRFTNNQYGQYGGNNNNNYFQPETFGTNGIQRTQPWQQGAQSYGPQGISSYASSQGYGAYGGGVQGQQLQYSSPYAQQQTPYGAYNQQQFSPYQPQQQQYGGYGQRAAVYDYRNSSPYKSK